MDISGDEKFVKMTTFDAYIHISFDTLKLSNEPISPAIPWRSYPELACSNNNQPQVTDPCTAAFLCFCTQDKAQVFDPLHH